jgi:hypothetical protein
MQRLLPLAGIAFALVLTAGGQAHAQPQPLSGRIAVLPVSGTNVHPGYLEAAQDVFKDHLMSTGRFTVLLVPGQPGTMETSGEDAVAHARELHADLAAVAHLTRLSGTGRVRLLVYQVGSGALVHSDSIAIAGGPDDLDPALKRLAVGMATGKTAAAAADIETVTQKQADPYLKEAATKSFGLRVGTIVPVQRATGDGAVAGFGLFWLYDARTFLADIDLDLHAGNGTAFDIGIGGYYPFSRGNFTPYLGAQAAFSITDFGGSGASGLRLQPTFGMLFGRLSTVQLRAEVGYFVNTFGERDGEVFTGAGSSPGGSKTYAHGPSFAIGIGF